MYVHSGQNQQVDALSHESEFTLKEDKILPKVMIPLEWFMANEKPLDLWAQVGRCNSRIYLWRLIITSCLAEDCNPVDI